jgi:integrase
VNVCFKDETLFSYRSLHRMPNNLVFCNKGGSALDPAVLRKDALYPILDWLGIPQKKGASGFHTFRHSAASIVNQQIGNLKLAQNFLGHSERAICGDLFPVVPNIENRNNSVALN